MATTFQCLYAQACIFNANKNINSTDTNGKFSAFIQQFGETINKKDFLKYSKRFLALARARKIKKDDIIDEYSQENWVKLSNDVRQQHSPVGNCTIC